MAANELTDLIKHVHDHALAINNMAGVFEQNEIILQSHVKFLATLPKIVNEITLAKEAQDELIKDLTEKLWRIQQTLDNQHTKIYNLNETIIRLQAN